MSDGAIHTVSLIVAGGFTLMLATSWLTWFIAHQFSAVRKLIHDELGKRDSRILALELYFIRHDPHFQPGEAGVEIMRRHRHATR